MFYASGTISALSAAADATGSAGFTAWQRMSEDTIDAVSVAICNNLVDEALVTAAKATDAWAVDTGAQLPQATSLAQKHSSDVHRRQSHAAHLQAHAAGLLLAGVDAVGAALAQYLLPTPTLICKRAALRLLLSPNLLQQLTFAPMLTVRNCCFVLLLAAFVFMTKLSVS